MYLGKKEEKAIAEYLMTAEPIRKRFLFDTLIYPALNKLAENVIHNRKFYNYGDDEYLNIKHDCVVHLHERLVKFNPTKGHKAFSYFNRVAINWVFANMKRVSEEINERASLEEIDLRRNLVNEVNNEHYNVLLSDFCHEWAIWGITNLDKLFHYKNGKKVPFSKKDKQIADAIFNLFANREYIDIYNKKALYILIREQVSTKTQSITDVVNSLKIYQKEMYSDFCRVGIATWKYYPEILEMEEPE